MARNRSLCLTASAELSPANSHGNEASSPIKPVDYSGAAANMRDPQAGLPSSATPEFLLIVTVR